MKQVILSANGLCKSFAHNGGQIHVLSQIDLELYEGDFTVVMGASGSGKSTMLYTLSGMDRATAGQVIYGGENIVDAKEKSWRRLGIVILALYSSRCILLAIFHYLKILQSQVT